MEIQDFKNRIRPDWAKSLKGILTRVEALRARAILAFDLDSTLFDNRPRQARILREFGEATGFKVLTGCQPEHWSSGWDMKAAMRNCGMSSGEVEAQYGAAKAFWQARFFTSEYCKDDVAIAGASEFVDACWSAGATVCYVTGRHEGMRAGTVEAMVSCRMRVPDAEKGGRVDLLMKPTLQENDDDFKRVAHEKLRGMGTVVAAFDNEPTHANDYRMKFPEALVIHLATDHSGRPVELLEGIVSVPHFDLRG